MVAGGWGRGVRATLDTMDEATHVAFLRAINTGDRRVTNEALLAPFVAAGFADVAAHQAAGNVVFRAAADCPPAAAELEPLLAAAYGFETQVFLRRLDELRSIVDAVPFTAAQLGSTEGRVQVTFLRDAPDADAIAAVRRLVPPDDRVVVAGAEWYWLPRAGISTSALHVPAVERVLGPMTMRTLGTLERLLAKFAG